jgi:hypothetical protein
MGNPFSRRHGFRPRREIIVREDAPEGLRAGLIEILRSMGLSYSDMRAVVCPVLHLFPNPNNWSEIPNVRDELIGLVQECEWYRVYDIAEACYQHFARNRAEQFVAPAQLREEEFTERLNELLEELGIGWQMIEGQIVTRGDQEFERVVAQAAERIDAAGLRNAKTELEEARADLSRRPEPDITGTIQHCMAALECVARVVSGDERATLGEVIQRHGVDIGIPRPLDNAIERMWGYASEMARHVREGRVPTREEAEFVLSISASVITYLLQRRPQN